MIYNIKQEDTREKKWYERSMPDEVQPVPWLGPIVIKYLEEILKPSFIVLEHGSGGSTLWLSKRVECIVAFENNLEWSSVIRELTKDNYNIYIMTDEINIPVNWKYDLILIDGEPVQDRAKWILQSVKWVKPNGWIVLDNANRPEYANERLFLQNTCQSFETFDCNDEGFTKYLVTDFYRMK